MRTGRLPSCNKLVASNALPEDVNLKFDGCFFFHSRCFKLSEKFFRIFFKICKISNFRDTRERNRKRAVPSSLVRSVANLQNTCIVGQRRGDTDKLAKIAHPASNGNDRISTDEEQYAYIFGHLLNSIFHRCPMPHQHCFMIYSRENVRFVLLLRADASDRRRSGRACPSYIIFFERREEYEEQGSIDVR